MRKLKNKALVFAKQLHSSLRKSAHSSRFVRDDVPYFSQWESRELVEKIITKKVKAEDDPRWRESGARSAREYASWSWSCCGMACFKMILAHKKNKIIPLVTLGKQCMKYGGYKQPLKDHPGLYYKPFVKFVEKEYGLKAKAVSSLTLFEIKQVISNEGYAIVSVTPEIRFPDNYPAKRGGHLVLVVGYDDKERQIYLNNPSGFKNSQELKISYDRFKKFFDNKGILIGESL